MDRMGNAIYEYILQVLNSPDTLDILGSLFVSIGAVILGVLKKPIEKLKNWVVSCINTAGTHVITEDYANSAIEVNNIISDLLDELDCARVGVIQFHNGAFFTLSNPIFKMSLVYEVMANGFAPAARYIRDSMVSHMISFVGPMMLERAKITTSGATQENFCKKWEDHDSCPLATNALRIVRFEKGKLPFGPVRCVLDIIGVEILYAALLKTEETKPLGILTIQYHDAKIADQNVKDHICDICSALHTLQELLHVVNGK